MSQDGAFWWNGTAWQPIVRRRQRPWGVIAIVVVIVVIVAFAIHAFARPIIDTNHYGASNEVIDSPIQFEFDYLAQDSCDNLTSVLTFYDAQGVKVSEFSDSLARQVNAGQSYHFSVTSGQSIDPSATRFTATPNCNS